LKERTKELPLLKALLMSDDLTKLSRNEELKAQSRFLRGTLSEGLDEQAFGGITEDDGQLVKFHGMYLQDDRDLRPERAKRLLDRAYMFMARLRVPGGVLTARQYLMMDKVATERGGGTLRLTTRQTIQFHGIIKSNVRAALRGIDSVLLDTIAACGDVNRNVMAVANPYASRAHAQAVEMARALSAHFRPRTGAWREIFIGNDLVAGGEPEDEPIYGKTYLPRKFKITVAVPPSNDVDVFAHDLSFIAIVEQGEIIGYTVTAGGGMGATHGDPNTFPRVGDVIGYCPSEQTIAVAEAVLTTQRDYGNRSDRKRARLKYTIEDRGLDWFVGEVNSRLDVKLERPRPFHFTDNTDPLGWHTSEDGLHHLTLFVEDGRVKDAGEVRLKSALKAVASLPGFAETGSLIMTGNQNIIIACATDAERAEIDRVLHEHGVDPKPSTLRATAMACVALPTCGLALAESERYLPSLITKIDALLARHGLADQQITLRMTGCPNGCARPYISEIGLVGRNPGRYNLMLGGTADGSRLNRLYRENLDEAGILDALDPLFADYVKNSEAGEGFGDFMHRQTG
jgi:sulfite reductase (NADPH) hemoprotein beta-component